MRAKKLKENDRKDHAGSSRKKRYFPVVLKF